MIGRIHAFFRGFRKKLSRSEWSLNLLNLPSSPEAAVEPGVVMLQVDGLSWIQAQKALDRNSLPFLKGLLAQHTFQLLPLYSGLPSTTPAVQGELFFGRKTAVPAFEFVDRKENRRFAMYAAEAAEHTARKLSAAGERPLLTGGSSYANVYIAGAAEARYCAQTMNLQSLLRSTHPLKLLFIVLLHLPKFFRIFGVAGLEALLAVSDFFRGIVSSKNLGKELKFIPTRVFICIMLRELIRFRVKMDLARGVPVVHANLMGYDEQAHRRGPDSHFAHWTLQGIDGVIKDIYRTALRSDCRAYRLLVYSDHGQQFVKSYPYETGRSVEQAVQDIALRRGLIAAPHSLSLQSEIETVYLRARDLLFQLRSQTRVHRAAPEQAQQQLAVTTMGPVGHVYLPQPVSGQERRRFARELVQEAEIPLVLYQDAEGVTACTHQGCFDLETDAAEVLGSSHPFLQDAATDLIQLCRHENAGDLVLSGWSPHQTPLSFSIESGAHGGPGFEETRGFVLLPNMIHEERPFLRPLDLRAHVLDLLHVGRRRSRPPDAQKHGPGLKVLTYNIHSCRHMDGKVHPQKTAETIQAFDADLIALQEVDHCKQRSSGLDQARYLAEFQDLEYSFFPVHTSGSEQYGLALLSRYPILEMKQDLLPGEANRPARERRGAMLALIESPWGEFRVVNTHLGLGVKERRLQMDCLLGPDWLGGLSPKTPLLFCGDINAGARSRVYRSLAGRLRDVQVPAQKTGYPKATFFSFYPVLRLDHIFVSRHWKPLQVLVPTDPETRRVSDHLPVYAELQIRRSSEYCAG